MLVSIRDYLYPQDPNSHPLLCTTKGRYFTWPSIDLNPDKPGFKEPQWIKSEDVDVENPLNVFTTIDTNSSDVWEACIHLADHLYWHKAQETIPMQKFEDHPDDHHSKPRCLFNLSQLFDAVGNPTKRKQLLTLTMKLEGQRGNDSMVPWASRRLSDANRRLRPCGEGIQHVEKILEIYDLTRRHGPAGKLLEGPRSLVGQRQRTRHRRSHRIPWNQSIPEKGQECLACLCHVYLVMFIVPKGKRRRVSTSSRRSLELHPSSAGTTNYFGTSSYWQSCSAMRTSTTKQTPTSDKPSCMPSMAHTT